MSPKRVTPDPTAVLKVGLKRVNLDERVFNDDELKRAPLVRSIGEEQARQLLTSASGRRFADQARVLIQGDAGDSLLFVLKGEARITVASGKDAAEIGIARKGDFLGEREVLGESPQRSYSAQAIGEVELVEIPKNFVHALAKRAPELWTHLRSVNAARVAAGAEMTDFLNRW